MNNCCKYFSEKKWIKTGEGIIKFTYCTNCGEKLRREAQKIYFVIDDTGDENIEAIYKTKDAAIRHKTDEIMEECPELSEEGAIQRAGFFVEEHEVLEDY